MTKKEKYLKRRSLFQDAAVKGSILLFLTIIFGSIFFFWNAIIIKKLGIEKDFITLSIVLLIIAVVYFIALKNLTHD